jgi:uroporphyrinogen-III decarboxylase
MPLFALGLEFDMRISGVTQREARLDVGKTVAGLVDTIRRSDYDWAMVFPDDYIEFEPLGLQMSDDENRPTMPTQYLPMDRDTLNRFRIPDAGVEMRLPIHLEMIRRVKEALGDTVCVVGRIAAPFSTLGLIYGIDPFLVALLEDPDLVRDNMAFFTDHQTAFGIAQLQAGADVLWLGDCVAASNFLRVEHYADFAFGPACAVAEALVKADGLVIYHSAEISVPHIKWQVQTPASAVNLGEGPSVAEVRRELGAKKCLMGNFDPKPLRDAEPQQIADTAAAMVRENLSGGGYVFNTGEGIMETTPQENVEAMLNAAREAAAAVLKEQQAGSHQAT